MKLEKLDLRALDASLAVDRDHAITDRAEGAVVLIRLAAQERPYPEECHDARENIVCLEGRIVLVAEGQRLEFSAGECCRVPAGLSHRWAGESAGLVLVHFGS